MNLNDYAKALPVDFLQELGLKDTADGLEIPYFDADGQPFRSRFRNDSKRWWGEGEGTAPYGLDRLSADCKTYAVLCEGESDTQSLWFNGLVGYGVPGGSTFKQEWAQYFKDYQTLYLAGDNDDAGRRFNNDIAAKLRAGGYVGQIRVIQIPNGEANG